MTDIRDTDQPETGNDEFENPGAKRIRKKSRPLVQSKRPREAPADLEHMESDKLQRVGRSSSANKRKRDQPEETTVDEGPHDARMTKMKMDEMLMDQVMAVSCGSSRVCVNEEKYEPATVRGLPADLVKKGQARDMKDLDDMNVLEWVKASTVPRDAKILDCGWASEVRARVVLKDYAVTKFNDLYAPTPTSMTVRCLLFHAAWFGLEVSVALMHAVASEPKFASADSSSVETPR